METPIEIACRDFDVTEALENTIREYANDLEKFYDRITSCRVTVEAPEINHHRKGRIFSVKLVVNVPGKQLVVNRQPQEDAYRAVVEAFRAMGRELEDYARKQRGDVKAKEEAPRGKVVRLFPEEDYGFIDAADGREVYFHRNSVVNADFDKLDIGTEVTFVDELGGEGPQATTVKIVE